MKPALSEEPEPHPRIPDHMRYSATPEERLRSLLRSLDTAILPRLTLDMRAGKILALCASMGVIPTGRLYRTISRGDLVRQLILRAGKKINPESLRSIAGFAYALKELVRGC